MHESHMLAYGDNGLKATIARTVGDECLWLLLTMENKAGLFLNVLFSW